MQLELQLKYDVNILIFYASLVVYLPSNGLRAAFHAPPAVSGKWICPSFQTTSEEIYTYGYHYILGPVSRGDLSAAAP